MISAAQSKAARALLDWSQSDLAEEAGLSESTIRDFEKGRRTPSEASLSEIQRALEGEGIAFIANGTLSPDGGAGVRFSYREEIDDIDGQIAQQIEIIAHYQGIAEEYGKNIDEMDKSEDFDRVKYAALSDVCNTISDILERKNQELHDLHEYKEKMEKYRDVRGQPKSKRQLSLDIDEPDEE